jgi:hypothetical protein
MGKKLEPMTSTNKPLISNISEISFRHCWASQLFVAGVMVANLYDFKVNLLGTTGKTKRWRVGPASGQANGKDACRQMMFPNTSAATFYYQQGTAGETKVESKWIQQLEKLMGIMHADAQLISNTIEATFFFLWCASQLIVVIEQKCSKPPSRLQSPQ